MEMVAKQEIVSILITFTVGFVAGGYLYINHFTKMISPDDVQDIAQAEQFTVVSEAYGGCRDNCPAFQVRSDGSYRYRYTPSAGALPVIVDGTLPRDLQRDISRYVTPNELKAQSTIITPTNCESFRDGIDLSFDITYDGQMYTLDSCTTAIEFNSNTWLALANIWNHLQSVR